MSGPGDRGPLDFGDEPRPGAPPGGPRPEPPAEPPPPARPPGASRYGWFIGVAGFLLVVLVTINSVTTGGVDPGGPDEGGRLAPFAVPLADSSLDGDANLATEEGQDELGARPACEVRGPEVLNICEQWERGPVVLALFPTDAGRCRSVLGQLDRMRKRFPKVRFAAVGSRGDRDELRGWGFPVGWDKDGAVAARYGLVGCPQVTFANKGGKVVDTTRREIDDVAFAGKVRELR
ncbi:MAG TPA: hypothetical protein VGW10_08385 [Solirubrobacteraceae bacterium]|nr:hypothetical protein [Solirubrobacteraceae bacterium]